MTDSPKPPPIVTSEHGITTEWCRAQAARNMRADPLIRERVERLFIDKAGGNRAVGLARCRASFPEVYEEELPA